MQQFGSERQPPLCNSYIAHRAPHQSACSDLLILWGAVKWGRVEGSSREKAELTSEPASGCLASMEP